MWLKIEMPKIPKSGIDLLIITHFYIKYICMNLYSPLGERFFLYSVKTFSSV